ncbi:MAG TPA: 7-cyano-7-deazaguanine synthase QueC [Gemmatimonadaceae bacterium]
MSRAVVLLSGGLDSTTTLAVARRDGHELYAMTFAYGQRHAVEVEVARRIAKAARVSDHVVVEIDLRTFGGSALTSDIAVPKNGKAGATIPVTYVPARNTIFLSYALAWSEVLGARDIYIGVNALDYSGYPDCRPEYVEAFAKMAALATKAGVEGTPTRIQAPLLALTKAEIIKLGTSLGVDYAHTTSCYDPSPNGEPCGECDACVLRRKGFSDAGVKDPLKYVRR